MEELRRHRVVSVIGTRPEAIKMAPVILEFRRREGIFEHTLLATGQHREMLDQGLSVFGIEPDLDLNLMQHDQELATYASRALEALSASLARLHPDAVLIEGDTTTVMVTALAAFYQGIPVGHVEAGLRSFDRQNPFPEEINRRIAGCLASLHFAPTERARGNLLREGVCPDDIFVTGNTIVDALRSIPLTGRFQNRELDRVGFDSRRVILVTAHRRESHGAKLRAVCAALKTLVERFGDFEVLYPVHLNPNVESVVYQEIGDIPRIHLVKPLSYIDLLQVMRRCYLILTDSGGIQEEAPSFNKPVLILREVTERPEVVEVGAGKLVGTDTLRITEEVARLLDEPREYAKMCEVQNPFGDGHAAERIVSILEKRLCLERPGRLGQAREEP